MINIIKIMVSASLIVSAAEIAKRSTFWGALLIVMPLNSILSLIFLYLDTKDSMKTIGYAKEIFLLLPISLVFFIPFLFANKTGWSFWINLSVGLILLGICLLIISSIKKIM